MKSSKKKKSLDDKIIVGISYTFLIIFALSILIPLLYIFQLTFSGAANTEFRILPRDFTFDNYRYVLENELIQRPFMNSIFITVIGTSVSMVLTVLFAYPLSRQELMGRKQLNFLVLLPMLFSLGFLPKFLLVKDLGLINTYTSLILPSALAAFNIIIMRNFFQSVPDSLIESARLDGAGEMVTLTKIVLPLSSAAIATIALFYMVSYWNSYTNVIMYINDRSLYTMQVILRSLVIEDSLSSTTDNSALSAKNLQYTTIVIAIIPVMIVYPFLQKYFVKGMLIGSVKG